MTSLVYVVRGCAGVYSSTTEWPVRAFLEKESAEALCARLNAWCEETGAAQPGHRLDDNACYEERADGRRYWSKELAKLHDPKPPEDPGFQNWGDVLYCVEEIPLGSVVDQT